MNLSQKLFSYWQSFRTISGRGSDGSDDLSFMPPPGVREHSTRIDESDCDYVPLTAERSTLSDCEADSAPSTVNLDWIPGELIYD
ncbi:MAG TPA: hypothetical protein V6D17_03490 [Candidatus Obscuribacterales bacterium]